MPSPKRLVVCADGTWNREPPPPGAGASNAARIARALRPAGSDGVPQVVYYQEGVGNRGFLDEYVGGYAGFGVDLKIRDAYLFLAANYAPGDDIFLFGISRGGFVALAVSRLLGRFGLPPKSELDRWPKIWRAYRDGAGEGPRWGEPPRVTLLGAWDTVEALGLPLPGVRRWTTPRVGVRGGQLGATVRHAVHALAADERRVAFTPVVWREPFPPGCEVEQRWFRGSHSDVCGGFGKRALADPPLAWVAERARSLGLAFDDGALGPVAEFAEPVEPSAQNVGWHRILPMRPRRPGSTSPATESVDPSIGGAISSGVS
jgi:uncharacterized protein (DUF2235 family)